ncbi:MAG: DUF2892 domain-containing protein [Armatimonadetes bacterium]|nr:DUF2892 domain-containing protein [Armatimonadota bacterium]
MKPNVGNVDRIIRFLLSFAFLALAVALPIPKVFLVPMMWFSGALFCSGVSRICPVYRPFKINTGASETSSER